MLVRSESTQLALLGNHLAPPSAGSGDAAAVWDHKSPLQEVTAHVQYISSPKAGVQSVARRLNDHGCHDCVREVTGKPANPSRP